MRILVTGREGQVVRALVKLVSSRPELVVLPVGRPNFDLTSSVSPLPLFEGYRPDLIVNAAAYTAVDQAENEPEVAHAANSRGAGLVAAAAASINVPVIQISTDYVFAGDGEYPYRETDPVGPAGVYGASKLAGERAVAEANPNHAILRTAWVYAAEGKNFVRTMLRLAKSRDEVGVVADQFGNPTSATDIAEGIIKVALNLLRKPEDPALRGTFHMTAAGETSWAGFAEAIFMEAERRGGPSARVRPIATSDYPTPARRPANSRLNCRKLYQAHGVALPPWQDGLARCIETISMSGDW